MTPLITFQNTTKITKKMTKEQKKNIDSEALAFKSTMVQNRNNYI